MYKIYWDSYRYQQFTSPVVRVKLLLYFNFNRRNSQYSDQWCIGLLFASTTNHVIDDEWSRLMIGAYLSTNLHLLEVSDLLLNLILPIFVAGINVVSMKCFYGVSPSFLIVVAHSWNTIILCYRCDSKSHWERRDHDESIVTNCTAILKAKHKLQKTPYW